MADTSLDDFFAKKDKSKKKSKAKLTPTDVLAKPDEGPKKVKKKKDKEQPGGLGLSTAEETSRKLADEEEWEDFEEQKAVDYTGLRIQTLQMREEEDKETGESDGEGEGGQEDGRDAASGPWNSSGPAPAAPVVEPPPPPPEPEEKKENTAPAKYVPPAQRHSAANPAPNPISRRANKKAPNIQSEEDFPTLGGGPQVSGGSAWGARKYESSGAGDIESNPGQRRGVNLSLENKFAALQD